MRDVPELILTGAEAGLEAGESEHVPYLHEFLASLGHTVDAFRHRAWGRELRGWAVSHVALFRAGRFSMHPARDPAASAAYWMVRVLMRAYEGEDAEPFIAGIRRCITDAARNPAVVAIAESLARSHWTPEETRRRASG